MIPTTIGRYELKEMIGRGGMATVFHGYDPRFRRAIAVKVMTLDFMGDEILRARFDREAQTIAALEHPAIVPVYDFGEEQGRPYLVMRLMNGGTLADRLHKGAIPIDDTAHILRRIGSALERAHQKGIIHRDLKPSNIMFDEYGDAFLGDFGIARLTENAVTLTGESVVGTPAYMSPEQVNGDKELDGRSDIYALGIICFEMLTGQRPFQGDTAARLMMKHVLDPVPDIRQMRPDLPPGVETVIARTLAKKPDERFATAGEMSDTLFRLLQGKEGPTVPIDSPAAASSPSLTPITTPALSPPAPPPDTTAATEIAPFVPQTEVMHPTFRAPPPQADAGSRRGRGWIIAAVAGIVALLVLIGAGVLLANLFNRDDVANSNSQGNNENGAVAAAPDNEAAPDPSDTTPSRTPRPTTTADPYPAAEEHMERFYEFLDQGEYLSALGEVNLALEIVADPWYRHERAYVYFQLGEIDVALEELDALIADDPDYQESYILRGIIYRETDRPDLALLDHLRAVAIVPDSGHFHHELAHTYRAADDLEAAIAEWDIAIELKPDDFWYYIAQADAYTAVEDIDQALSRMNDAAARFPEVDHIYSFRAEIYMWHLGDAEAALADINRAMELDPHNSATHGILGQLYLHFLADPETALTYFDEALTLDAELAWLYEERGLCYRALGNYDAALADFQHLAELEPENPLPYLEQGWTFLDHLNQPQEAIEAFDRAIAINQETAEAYLGRGNALRALDADPQEALDAWSSCVAYNPHQYWCYFDLAHLYDELGQINEAVANFQLYLEYVDETDCIECQQDAEAYIDDHGG